MIRKHARVLSVAAIGLALAGCGGGQGVSSVSPATSSVSTSSVAQNVTLTINIPGRAASTASTRRTPAYVGAGTKSATIIVTPSGGTASTTTVNCTSVCSATLAVFPGTVSFTVNLYDNTNGSGNLLSTGTTTQTIAPGATTAVNLTFNGVPAALSINGLPTSVTAAIPETSQTFAVSVLDADQNTIVGSYQSPVTLTSSNPALVTVQTNDRASNQLTNSNENVTFSYTGSAGTNPTVTASAPGASSAVATLSIIGDNVTTFANGGFLNAPAGLAVDAGYVYVANSGSTAASVANVPPAVMINPSGFQSAYISTGGANSIYGALGVAIAPPNDPSQDSLYIANTTNGTLNVFRNNPAGNVSGFAVPGLAPYGVAVDLAGNVYASLPANGTVVEYSPAGTLINTISGFSQPTGIVLDTIGNLFVVDSAISSIYEVPNGSTTPTLLAGANTTLKSGNVDGVGSAALFNGPIGIAVGRGPIEANKFLYVADTGNNEIRKINIASGAVTTIAGSGPLSSHGAGDGAGPNAQFNHPTGIAIDANNFVYISDSLNNSIRLLR